VAQPVRERKAGKTGMQRTLKVWDGKEENGMRQEKEIREALKRLKDEHLRKMRDLRTYATVAPRLVTMIGTLEWALGDKKSLPDFL